MPIHANPSVGGFESHVGWLSSLFTYLFSLIFFLIFLAQHSFIGSAVSCNLRERYIRRSSGYAKRSDRVRPFFNPRIERSKLMKGVILHSLQRYSLATDVVSFFRESSQRDLLRTVL